MLTTRLLLQGIALAALVAAREDVLIDPALIAAAHEIQPSGSYPVFDNAQEPVSLDPSFIASIFDRVADDYGPSKRSNDDPKDYLYDGNHEIAGFVDRETGQTRIFPDYGALKPLTGPVDIKGAFVKLEKYGNAFPPDDTRIELLQGSSLQGYNGVQPHVEGSGTLARRWNDAGSTFITTGLVRRFVDLDSGNKLPVCGPGSQAVFGLGEHNKFVSLSYQWKTAKQSHKTRQALSVERVVWKIKEALKKTGCKTPLNVTSVDICLYDSGLQNLQPTYRVQAKPVNVAGLPRRRDLNSSIPDLKGTLTFVPLGGPPTEPLGPDGQGFGEGEEVLEPLAPTNSTKRSFVSYFDARNMKSQITVGRYTVRNDTDGFLEDARNFWSSLATSTIYSFVRRGFYWAYPRLYNSDANYFINDVNIALTEAHGKFHGFSTLDGSGTVDFVNIPSDLAPGGYGPISNNGKGQLGYWFIDACEVMPTISDFVALKDPNPSARTFNPWWPVFRGGVHAILSWRTSSLFADNTAAAAASFIALGRPVVAAWLDAANADPAYLFRPTYVGAGTGLPDWPYGRAAAIFRCGRVGDKANNLENLGAPTCLTAMWWNNN